MFYRTEYRCRSVCVSDAGQEIFKGDRSSLRTPLMRGDNWSYQLSQVYRVGAK